MEGVLDLLERARPDGVSCRRPSWLMRRVEPERMRWAGQVDGHPEAACPRSASSVLIDEPASGRRVAAARGFDPVLHFHAGSYVESADEIDGASSMAGSIRLVGMCLDTGHARFGGADPTRAAARYRHDASGTSTSRTATWDVLAEVRASGGGLMEAWARGVFCELGPRHGRARRHSSVRSVSARLRGLAGRRAGPLPDAGRYARGAAGAPDAQPGVARTHRASERLRERRTPRSPSEGR